MLRLSMPGTLSLRGPRSGRVYLFSHREAIVVLGDDADAMVRSGVLELRGQEPGAGGE